MTLYSDWKVSSLVKVRLVIVLFKMSYGEGTEEMAWQTAAVAAFAEDLGLILSTYMLIDQYSPR